MKKIVCLLAALLLLSTMAVTVSAKGGITFSNAVGQAGQQVTMTITLNEAVTADQVLVVYEYDNTLLTPEVQYSAWATKGDITDFIDPFAKDTSAKGAWAVTKAVELKEDLCTLAFHVKSGVNFDSTAVRCKVTVMKDGKVVGEYTADAQVLTSCSHNYSIWKSRDNTSHDKVCTICGDKQSGVHSWDEGKLTADPNDSAKAAMLFTCTLCSGTKYIEMEGVRPPVTESAGNDSQTDNQGDQQQGNQQGDQQQGNQQGNQSGDQQSGDPFGDQQTGNQQTGNQQSGNQGNHAGDHTHDTKPVDPFTGLPEGESSYETQPQASKPYVDYNEPDHTHPETTAPQYIQHDHDHDHTTETAPDAATPIVIVAAVAVLVGALVFFVKKKW